MLCSSVFVLKAACSEPHSSPSRVDPQTHVFWLQSSALVPRLMALRSVNALPDLQREILSGHSVALAKWA